jgi:hypothetical protein
MRKAWPRTAVAPRPPFWKLGARGTVLNGAREGGSMRLKYRGWRVARGSGAAGVRWAQEQGAYKEGKWVRWWERVAEAAGSQS